MTPDEELPGTYVVCNVCDWAAYPVPSASLYSEGGTSSRRLYLARSGMAHRITLGDFFQIPLPDSRYAYCQHVNWNNQMGFLVEVFDRISDNPLELEDLDGAKPLFPPVFVGLRAAVSSGRWKRIGNRTVTDFQFPLFRATSATKPGKYDNWWLFDGNRQRFIGALPPEMRSLAVEVVWGYELLEQRIATGHNLFDGIF